jgi:hypothetical protein
MNSKICPKCGFAETNEQASCPECGYVHSGADSIDEDQFNRTGRFLLQIIIGAIVVLAIAVAAIKGTYYGAIIAFLLVSGYLMHWILGKLGKNNSEWFKVAIAVQTANLFLLLVVLFYAQYRIIIIDIIILGICLVWYFLQPRLTATVVLCLYHLAGIIMNFNSLFQTDPSNTNPYIIIYLILRVVAVIVMIGHYWNYKELNFGKEIRS